MQKKTKNHKIVQETIQRGTPVAKRFAYECKRKGQTFEEFEDVFMNIVCVEGKLYTEMKDTLIEHIRRHALDAETLQLFDDFVAVPYFNKTAYIKVLKKVRKCYVAKERSINSLSNKLTDHSDKDSQNPMLYDISVKQQQLKNLQYLISKITEYLQKVDDLAVNAYELVKSGKTLDFDAWSNKMILQDHLFEENKQFLKQCLHHVDTLEKNKCKLGIDDLRMLLYNRQGCRRAKLYRRVEEWIIKIYYSLESEEERRIVYKDICNFIAEVVPDAGYISPIIIGFIFDRDFLSDMSRDLLLKIQPVIDNLSMMPLIIMPLSKFYAQTVVRIRNGEFGETDEYVLEIMQCYCPKSISPEIMQFWNSIKQ